MRVIGVLEAEWQRIGATPAAAVVADVTAEVEALERLRGLARRRTLTLLTATKHPEISEAVVLADLLRA